MYNCQQSLMIHIANEFTAPILKTLKEYAGEIGDANKLTAITPACLMKYDNGQPMAEQPWHVFDLLVVTDSQVFDKEANQNSNLQLCSSLVDYLQEHHIFNRQGGGNGVFEIAREKV